MTACFWTHSTVIPFRFFVQYSPCAVPVCITFQKLRYSFSLVASSSIFFMTCMSKFDVHIRIEILLKF